jgi:hypothetical protein
MFVNLKKEAWFFLKKVERKDRQMEHPVFAHLNRSIDPCGKLAIQNIFLSRCRLMSIFRQDNKEFSNRIKAKLIVIKNM